MRQIPLGTKGTFTLRVLAEHLADRFKDAICAAAIRARQFRYLPDEPMNHPGDDDDRTRAAPKAATRLHGRYHWPWPA